MVIYWCRLTKICTESIVIPELHQKFSLSTTENGEHGAVIRRNNCILLLSRTRTKVMVLQFQTFDDCLRFADRFHDLMQVSGYVGHGGTILNTST